MIFLTDFPSDSEDYEKVQAVVQKFITMIIVRLGTLKQHEAAHEKTHKRHRQLSCHGIMRTG
jgi:hypothetical protein